jgi:hypothetical protein
MFSGGGQPNCRLAGWPGSNEPGQEVRELPRVVLQTVALPGTETHRCGLLSALRADTQATYGTDLLWETLSARNAPGRSGPRRAPPRAAPAAPLGPRSPPGIRPPRSAATRPCPSRRARRAAAAPPPPGPRRPPGARSGWPRRHRCRAARAENRRFGLLHALCAHTKP